MSLEPARLNFSFWKGTTFQKRLTYHQGDVDSGPVDLTGFAAELVIKDNIGTLLTLSDTNSGIVLGGSAGTIDLIIPFASTSVSWRTASYTLTLTAPSGSKDILLFGNFSAKGSNN